MEGKRWKETMASYKTTQGLKIFQDHTYTRRHFNTWESAANLFAETYQQGDIFLIIRGCVT